MPTSPKSAQKKSARGTKPAAKKTSAKKLPGKAAAKKATVAKKVSAAKKGATKDFGAVFQALRGLMARHASALVVKVDTSDNYYVNSPKPYAPYNNKVLFFGAVQVKKSYVSYHFFPVYMFPVLLKS